MQLTNICIKRPVFSTVLSLIIIVLGYISFKQLQVRQYPKTDIPTVTVVTQLHGASPKIIEAQITKLLEDSFAGLQGLKEMRSNSKLGESKIYLFFDSKQDINNVVNDIRDKTGRMQSRLPQEATRTQVYKADADEQSIMSLALYSEQHKIVELADYAKRFLSNKLENLGGVSSINVWGSGDYEMHIILNPIKMANFGITPVEITEAVRAQNLEKPAGRIKTESDELVVTTKAALSTEEDFENIILKSQDGSILRIRDIGYVKLKMQEKTSIVRFNGKPAIEIGIKKQSTANPLEIAKQLYKLLPDLKKSLPVGMRLEVATDSTIFVDQSIKEVYWTIIEAIFLVIAVILLFLRSIRAVIIPIVTIPISIMGTFFLMYHLGFTINVLTLLALMLAVGMVVDDAIVILENIYRYIEEGMKPIEAAFKGSKEIGFAIIAMTITLAAVYTPIALLSGNIGTLFTEFAITLAASVIISGFVALTLSPMMCSRLLKPHNLNNKNKSGKMWNLLNKIDQKIDQTLSNLETSYEQFLQNSLNFSIKGVYCTLKGNWLLTSLGVICSLIGYIFFTYTKSEFIPIEDQGQIFARMMPLTNSANIAFISKYAFQAENIIRQTPEVEKNITSIHQGMSYAYSILSPPAKRNRSTEEIANKLNEQLREIVGLDIHARQVSSGIGGKSDDFKFKLVVTSTKEFEALIQKAKEAMSILKNTDLFVDKTIEANFSNDIPEYVIQIDREKAASLKISAHKIASAFSSLVGDNHISKFKLNNKQFDVKIRLADKEQKSIDKLTNIFIKGEKIEHGKNIPVLVALSELIIISKRLAPVEIPHVNTNRSITVSGTIKAGYDVKASTIKAIEAVQKLLSDENTEIKAYGPSKRLIEEGKKIFEIFGLALLFIFLVLAAQYESWLDPWIILLTVPLSLAGGALFLNIFGQTINLYSQIGFITLIGLITKHGILIVDFANKLRSQGLNRLDAIIKAAKLRLRPILMTTFAMVIGAVPLAFSSGSGMESRRPIGLVIVGGMIIGTFFTLFVLPAMYTLISRKVYKGIME